MGREAGVVVTGVLCGPKTKHVKDKDTGDPLFDLQYFFIVTGSEVAPKVVGGKDEEAAMVASLKPLVGSVVSLKVEPWNFRELHFLSVEKAQ